jgi:hypothetical protein
MSPFLRALAAAALPGLALAAEPPASCAPVLASATKLFSVDHAMTVQAGERAVESMQIAGVLYEKDGGRWERSAASVADALRQQQDFVADAQVYTCQAGPDGEVGGRAATSWRIHIERDGQRIDMTTWLAKDGGLPLKSEHDVDADGERRHLATSFRYDDIHAPAP